MQKCTCVALFALFGAASAVASAPSAKSLVERGFIEGFLSARSADTDLCISGAEIPVVDYDVGMADIKEGIKRKNLIDIFTGFESLFNITKDLPAAMKACGVMEADLKAVLQVVKGFHSLEDVKKHIGVDFGADSQGQIAADFENMIQKFEQKQYQEFGKHAGEFLHRLLIGPETISESSLPDCSATACPSKCQCAEAKCTKQINSCLGAASCAKGKSCIDKCACGDTACVLGCAKSIRSLKALPLAACLEKQCGAAVFESSVGGSSVPSWLPLAGLGFVEGFVSDNSADTDMCILGALTPIADISTGISDIKMGIKAGLGIKKAISDTKKAIPDITNGISEIVEGIKVIKEDNKKGIAEIKKGFNGIQEDISDLKADIKKDINARHEDFEAGLESLVKILKDVPAALKTCGALEADVKAIVEVLEEFHSFKDVMDHIKADFGADSQGQIAAQFEMMALQFKQKQYEEFGKHAGEFLHRVFVGPESMESSTIVVV